MRADAIRFGARVLTAQGHAGKVTHVYSGCFSGAVEVELTDGQRVIERGHTLQPARHLVTTAHVEGGLMRGGGYRAECNCGWNGQTFLIKDCDQMSGAAMAMADAEADSHARSLNPAADTSSFD